MGKYIYLGLATIFFFFLEFRKPFFTRKLNIKKNLNNFLLTLSSLLIIKLTSYMGLFSLWSDLIPSIGIEIKNMSALPRVGLTIIILDFCIYWQHRFFHLSSFLFKLHIPHHTDEELNVSSALRFHPSEIFLSAFYKLFIVNLIGISFTDYALYEVILTSFALFNHSNIKIPERINDFLEYFFITPTLHYVHHINESKLMNMNFGNIFNIWDRLFGTYLNWKTLDLGHLKQGVKNYPQKNFSSLLFLKKDQ
ncbi:MAG: sterol desaturase family protein [Halobacteriovoraceae bacterium]|nr:sterol desaturase family protein [Halobacteriovoraceae bacterium]